MSERCNGNTRKIEETDASASANDNAPQLSTLDRCTVVICVSVMIGVVVVCNIAALFKSND